LGDFDALRHHYGSVIQPSKLGCATLTLHGIDAFVLTHLLMQLGNGYASIPAALVLVNICSHPFRKIVYEGSFSLSAEAQVFMFLSRFDAKASLVALSYIDK